MIGLNAMFYLEKSFSLYYAYVCVCLSVDFVSNVCLCGSDNIIFST